MLTGHALRFWALATLLFFSVVTGRSVMAAGPFDKLTKLSRSLKMPKLPQLPKMPSLQMPKMPKLPGETGSKSTRGHPRKTAAALRESEASDEPTRYVEDESAEEPAESSVSRRRPRAEPARPTKIEVEGTDEELAAPAGSPSSSDITSRISGLRRQIEGLGQGEPVPAGTPVPANVEVAASAGLDMQRLAEIIPGNLIDSEGKNVRGVLASWQSVLSEQMGRMSPEEREQMMLQAGQVLEALKQAIAEEIGRGEAAADQPGTTILPDGTEESAQPESSGDRSSHMSTIRQRMKELGIGQR